MKQSDIFKELYSSRNFKGSFRYGLYGGLLYGGFNNFISKVND